MKIKKLLLCFLLPVLLTSCAKPKVTPSQTPGAPLPSPIVRLEPPSRPASELTALPTLEAMCPPTPPEGPRPHYQLDMILNYYSHYAMVVERIRYTNRSSSPLKEILLLVPPRVFEDAYQQSSLRGERVSSFREEGIRTYVTLSSPLLVGETTIIDLVFRLNFPEYNGIFAWTNRQTNISDWYPFIPPLDEKGDWLAYDRVVDDNNIIVGEYLVQEMADFDVSLQLTDRAELIEVAASAPQNNAGNGLYRYTLENARAFAFSVSDSYFEYEILHKGVRIRTYVFMNQQETGKGLAELAVKALDLFADLYYPYPREMVSIVSADFLHNMEMDGMVFLSHKVVDFYDDTCENDVTILAPHELSHQWFYSLVGNNAATEPWLDEALATYQEALYYERYHPERLQWWWSSRIFHYDHSGAVNADIHIPGGYEAYRGAVYLNGALFLQKLRETVGDEAFFASLKDYSCTNSYRLATRADFFAAFGRHSSVDLKPLLSQFFSD